MKAEPQAPPAPEAAAPTPEAAATAESAAAAGMREVEARGARAVQTRDVSPTLKQLLLAADAGSDGSCDSFIRTTKSNHVFAIDYCARLLRITTRHHGPVRDRFIHPWLRRDAVDEFMRFVAEG